MSLAIPRLKLLLFFLVGIFVGFVIAFMFGWLMSYIDPSFLGLTSSPRSFGSINISATPHEPGSNRTLLMTKDNIPFLAINTSESGEIRGLSLFKDNKNTLCFTMSTSDVPGKWERAIYANESKNGKFNGEMYIDINFDGQFNVKRTFNSVGEKTLEHLYVDQDWKQVDRCSLNKAILGQTKYYFDPNLGYWCEK